MVRTDELSHGIEESFYFPLHLFTGVSYHCQQFAQGIRRQESQFHL